MEQEKKVLVAYSVKRYDDGSVDVADLELEGTERMGAEDIYNDIESVNKLIQIKRTEQAALVGAYNGIAKYFNDVRAMQEQQAQAAAEPTVEK